MNPLGTVNITTPNNAQSTKAYAFKVSVWKAYTIIVESLSESHSHVVIVILIFKLYIIRVWLQNNFMYPI